MHSESYSGPSYQSIEDYRRRVEKFERLSKEREYELVVAWQENQDQQAREELVSANLRYVVQIARKRRSSGIPVMDLVSAGHIGLLIALERYEPSRDLRFITYASHWIKALMIQHVLKHDRIVSTGTSALRSRLFHQLGRKRAKYQAMLGCTPEAEEMAVEETLYAVKGTREQAEILIARMDATDVVFDAPPPQMGDEVDWYQFLPSRQPTADELLEAYETKCDREYKIHRALDVLNEREKLVVSQRLMADTDDALSLQEIGDIFGVCRERIRQVELNAKAKLSKVLLAYGI